MIPVSLTLQGIHSYQEQQTIDFKSLTQGQLFGIFGNVGSGKSTILEAILLALYGRSERLEKQRGIGYDVMNLRSNQLYIDFTFEVGANRQLYRFTVNAKRNRKHFDDVGALQNGAYQRQDNQWLPLAVKSAEPILGLSYEHFKRTIIIPQGKFQEFLQLSDSQRTEMMQDLFNLHRFDLTNNVKILKSRTNNQLQQIEGELAGYREVSRDNLIQAWEALHTMLMDIDRIKRQFKEKDTEYQRLHQLKEKYEYYQKVQANFQALARQKATYDEKGETLRQVQQCRFNFQDRLERSHKLKKSIEDIQSRLQQANNTLQELEREYQKAEQQVQQLTANHIDKSHLQQTITDLRTIRSILKFNTQIQEKRQKLEKANQGLEKVQQIFKDEEKRWQTIQQQLQEQYQQTPDQSKLSAVKSWFTQQNTYLEKRDQAMKELQQKQKQIAHLKTQRQDLVKQYQLDSLNKAFPDYSVKVLRSELEALKHQYQSEQDKLDREIRALQTQQALEYHAENLEPGKPCPVCGSYEHPNPINAGDTAEYIAQKEQRKGNLRHWQEAIAQAMEGLEGLRQQYKQLKAEYDRQNQLYQEAQQQVDSHQKAFAWPAYKHKTEQEIDKALAEAKAQHDQLQSLEQQRNQAEKAKEKARQQRDQADKDVQELNREIHSLEERITAYQQQINSLTYEDYAYMDQEALEKLEQQWQDDQQQLQSLTEKLDQQKPEIDKQRQLRDKQQATLHEQQRQWQDLQEELNHLLAQSEFDNLGQVQRLLDDYQDTDLEAHQNEISRFQQQYQSQKQELEELEQQLIHEEPFEQQAYEAAKKAREQASQMLQEIQQATAVQADTVGRLQQQFTYKQKLESQYQSLQDRIDNLKTFERLFRGKGFVRYISTVFIHELCQVANERFRRLTNNQLQLEATNDASLQIRDLLNDGRVRSVKTLSGGQTFQVSLSLALALAEQIQQLTRSPQNFFFLDEGFGSLDRESLNLVFDTLNRLRSENRIVGIISHVEELKEGLETALNVENHPERGSVITHVF